MPCYCFDLGDFYEMFYEDAQVGARLLELVLTSREAGKGNRIPMCGVPVHAVESYAARLLEAGFKVAICDQVEDARLTRGLVRREVVRVLTPGTVVEESMLQERATTTWSPSATYPMHLALPRSTYRQASLKPPR